nr:hypothetical protein [uncultured Acinetobacter sp.]
MTPKEVRIYHIPNSHGVDAIDVFICWYGEHQSQITIRCWDQAWTGYRGGHWYERAEQYLVEVYEKHGLDHLTSLFCRTRAPKERAWVTSILRNVCEFLKTQEPQQ